MSSKNHFPLLLLAHVYTIFHLHQNQSFYILPNVSFCPHCHASFCTPFVPTQGIHAVCDSPSHPFYHTIYSYSCFQFEYCLIFAFIVFVLMAYSCAAIISDSVCLFILLSLSHSHFFFPCNFFNLVKELCMELLLFQHNTSLISSPFLKFFHTLNHSQMLLIISIYLSSCYVLLHLLILNTQ